MTWGDAEPDPASFEPVDVRPYFPNREFFRTRGRRQHLRYRKPPIVRRPQRRAVRSRRVRPAATRARAPGRKDDAEPAVAGALA